MEEEKSLCLFLQGEQTELSNVLSERKPIRIQALEPPGGPPGDVSPTTVPREGCIHPTVPILLC